MEVTTVVGSGVSGDKDGTSALFNFPSALAVDSSGNLFITDAHNHKIKRLSPDGTVTTIAGSGKQRHRDGMAEEAEFGQCYGIVVDSQGTIFVTDFSFNTIRRIKDGIVSTLAGKAGESGKVDGKGEDARFWSPRGICFDSDGCLLVVDSGTNCIRKVTMDGFVSTLLRNEDFNAEDDGDSSFSNGRELHDIWTNGEVIYVTDYDGDCVKKISNGKVVSLKRARGVVGVTFFNGCLYTASNSKCLIFKGENFEIFAGKKGQKGHVDGSLVKSTFRSPYGMVVSNGSLYVADRGSHCIRRVLLPFVEWTPSLHLQTLKSMRDAVRTLVLMRKRGGTLWDQVPREILFVIIGEIHRLFWGK